jgi:hypothetical protein
MGDDKRGFAVTGKLKRLTTMACYETRIKLISLVNEYVQDHCCTWSQILINSSNRAVLESHHAPLTSVNRNKTDWPRIDLIRLRVRYPPKPHDN